MFQIKICGIRLKRDVDAVRESGADAVGLNFHPPSIRHLDPLNDSTRELSEFAKQSGLLRVGVFVNRTTYEIGEILSRVGLDAIQLHGDEKPGFLGELRPFSTPIIRAIKLPPGSLSVAEIERYAADWADNGCQLLFDADAGKAHGGEGLKFDWISLHQWSGLHPKTTWTLAGGLNAQNVAEAIHITNAQSVDVASGVEESRGEKSEIRIAEFCRVARDAFLKHDPENR